MKQYDIKGMSCAACAAAVEKATSNVKGVKSCTVSLLTNSLSVEGDVSDKAIIQAIRNIGYNASIQGTDSKKLEEEYDEDLQKMKIKLWFSLILLSLLMYVSMGVMMFNFPIFSFIKENPLALGMLECLITIMIMIIHQKYFISGFKALVNRLANMDTLVALGSAVSFGYSVVILFVMAHAQVINGIEASQLYIKNLYFDSSAMILTLISVGKTLELSSKGKTKDALKALMSLSPKKALLLINDEEKEVDIDKVQIGDIFIVKPGESIPVDGIIIEGYSAIDESTLSGESIPVDKTKNDEIFAATINQSGYFKAQATRVGEDTTFAQIVSLVYKVSVDKAPIAKMADKVASFFVPIVLLIALLTFVIWIFMGESVGFALNFATSVLVISCPCSLGLATPVAIMVGNGVAAKNNLLFKTASALENTGKSQIIALDKTGTLTLGKPAVKDIVPIQVTKEELIQKAYALEKRSEHPLAKAIVSYAEERNFPLEEVDDFMTYPGNGLSARLHLTQIWSGHQRFIAEHIVMKEEWILKANALAQEGKTPLYFAEEGRLLGLIAVADTLKEDSYKTIQELKDLGLRVVMLTGDNNLTAKVIADSLNIDYVSELLPQDKERVIQKLKKHGQTIMVGDGVNDALALKSADIGFAIGAGSDIALDSSDVVISTDQLTKVASAIRLSRKTLLNIRENLFWAFFYNVLAIPLAAGLFYKYFGIKLNPMIGAMAMSFSSIFVVLNALRLNHFNPHKASKKHLKPITLNMDEIKENKEMKKVIHIEGMMCSHCEASVKKVLLKVSGVENVETSFKTGTAICSLNKDIDNSLLKEVVEKENYKVTSIE